MGGCVSRRALLSPAAKFTNPHDQFVLVLPRALTPKGHASPGVAHKTYVTMLQLRGMSSSHILTQLPHVLLAEIRVHIRTVYPRSNLFSIEKRTFEKHRECVFLAYNTNLQN